MKIHIYTISKGSDDRIDSIISEYKGKAFNVEISIFDIFNNDITKAQKLDSISAKSSYTRAFEKYLNNNSILLDLGGKSYDSITFSHFLNNAMQNGEVRFFIAGAFGFESSLLQKHKSLTLSPLTFSHSIAKLVLVEQIYRALSIINSHPYHKI